MLWDNCHLLMVSPGPWISVLKKNELCQRVVNEFAFVSLETAARGIEPCSRLTVRHSYRNATAPHNTPHLNNTQYALLTGTLSAPLDQGWWGIVLYAIFWIVFACLACTYYTLQCTRASTSIGLHIAGSGWMSGSMYISEVVNLCDVGLINRDHGPVTETDAVTRAPLTGSLQRDGFCRHFQCS